MARFPKKVAIIGLDCAQPARVDQYAREGYLPNIKKMIEGGVLGMPMDGMTRQEIF